MPHRPRRHRHWHVVSFPPIEDPHRHQPEELGLVGRHVPPSEEPFHEPVDGKGIIEKVLLLTKLWVVMTKAINCWIPRDGPRRCNDLRQA